MFIEKEEFQNKILTWFKQHGRKHLPWQQQPTAYHVWISEIMLQQTQVSTVIPYFERFIDQFPDVITLANAPIDKVLALWSGLGYYARGRNLHRSAQIITQQFAGKLPATLNELIELPGIGRSTAGAILSLGYGKSAAILDGNVKRVLARFHLIDGWPGQLNVSSRLWQIAEHYSPETSKKKISAYTQAMMDLGAMVCTRTQPKCGACPLKNSCQANLQQCTADYPHAKPKKTIPTKQQVFLIFRDITSKKILLEKRPPSGIWGALWSLPQCAVEDDIVKYAKQHYGLKIINSETLPAFRHTFSHFHLDISPTLIDVQLSAQVRDNLNIRWYNVSEALQVGLPMPVTKLLQHLRE